MHLEGAVDCKILCLLESHFVQFEAANSSLQL